MFHILMDAMVMVGLLIFSLRATIYHRGPSTHSGHYTASILIDLWVLDSNRTVGVWWLPWHWLAHLLHPINRSSGNKRWNLWVEWCVSSWWPFFPSRNSVLIYVYRYIYVCILYRSSGCRTCIYIHRECIQYWWRCTTSQSIGQVYRSVRFFCWMPLVVFFGFTNCVLLYDNKSNTRMLMIIGIRLTHFETCNFAFCGVWLLTWRWLAHLLHPINRRSGNKRWNLWVEWCVSSWWPFFPSRNSVLIYVYRYIYVCILYRSSGCRTCIYIHRECIQYWWRCTTSQSIGQVYRSVRFFCWMPLVVFFGFTNCVLLYDNKSNTRMLMIIGIRLTHFETRYFAFCNLSPPRMCLSLDLLSEYQHGTIGPLYVTYRYSTRMFYRGFSGFATDCPCGVWCCGSTTCLLYVGPPFANQLLSNCYAVGLT